MCSHDPAFDNLGYFLPRNGIDRLISLKDFPKEDYENVWGVNDETLFDRGLSIMDSLDRTGHPFLSVILTISTHPPLAVPEKTDFKPTRKDVADQVYEYADYAIRKFMTEAERHAWYTRTLFAFVGDHGVNMSGGQENALALNHVPFFVFTPERPMATASASLGMQTDIFPTLMRLAGISYVNNTMGMDLLNDARPFAYFSQDKRLCVLNHVYYLVIDKSETEILYRLGDSGFHNYLARETLLADSMKRYAYSMLQTTQFMIDNGLVGPPRPPGLP
jgi:phosphoglycerol transferase MdoB-like AlkP superfamily enzyme